MRPSVATAFCFCRGRGGEGKSRESDHLFMAFGVWHVRGVVISRVPDAMAHGIVPGKLILKVLRCPASHCGVQSVPQQ